MDVGYIKKPTQEQRILEVLQNANGEWVNGRYFNTTMMISQYHSRISGLQEGGHNIEPSPFKDEYGFKSYRIKKELKQVSLL